MKKLNKFKTSSLSIFAQMRNGVIQTCFLKNKRHSRDFSDETLVQFVYKSSYWQKGQNWLCFSL